jgi:predicted TIM-barrel fold metal-dependent hydrolase
LANLGAVAGRPRDEYGVEPMAFAELRPGCYDLKARIDDVDANGVLGSMCFPSLMGFGGGLAMRQPDKAYGKALIQAYNDWHVHECAGGAPGRIIPLGTLPIWDINASVAEAKRLASLGVHAVTIPENPAFDRTLPSVHSDHWDPLWRGCADNDIIVYCHIGPGSPCAQTSPDEPVSAWMVTVTLATSFNAADWLFAPMWKKFPSLRMALSEANIGWIPLLMERADFIYDHHGAWTHEDFGGELPSDVFRRHFIVCFIDDKFGLKNRHEIGIDKITWECDYPHSDSTWPDSAAVLWKGVKDIPDDELNKITHLNAMREFSFRPFDHLSREKCTVGALKHAAREVDTRPKRGLGGGQTGRKKPSHGGRHEHSVAEATVRNGGLARMALVSTAHVITGSASGSRSLEERAWPHR